jgi:hypothetical protein
MDGRFYQVFYFYFCKRMNHHTQLLKKIISRKAAVLLLSAISVAAFATLGDGKKSKQSIENTIEQ